MENKHPVPRRTQLKQPVEFLGRPGKTEGLESLREADELSEG